VDFLSPPGSAWSVDLLRRNLQPNPRQFVELSELEPELSSYDSLLSSELEVAYVS